MKEEDSFKISSCPECFPHMVFYEVSPSILRGKASCSQTSLGEKFLLNRSIGAVKVKLVCDLI